MLADFADVRQRLQTDDAVNNASERAAVAVYDVLERSMESGVSSRRAGLPWGRLRRIAQLALQAGEGACNDALQLLFLDFSSFIVSCGAGALSIMPSAARTIARVLTISLLALGATAFAAEKQRIHVDDYAIQAVVIPQTHQLKAQARVRFTALDDINIAIFELHNDLRPTRVLDANGEALPAERVSQDSTIRISLANSAEQRAPATP